MSLKRSYLSFKQIMHSFYDAKFYQGLVNWRGLGLRALLASLLIVLLSLFLINNLYFNHIIKELNPASTRKSNSLLVNLIEQIPVIYIQNGKFHSESEKPFVLQHPNLNRSLIIIDTSYQPKDLYKTNPYLIITKDFITFNFEDNKRLSIAPSDIKDTTELNQEYFYHSFSNNKNRVLLSLFSIDFYSLSFYLILKNLLVAGIIALLANFHFNLPSYKIAFRAANFATIPTIFMVGFSAILLKKFLASEVINQLGQYFNLIFLAYFVFALYNINRVAN